MRAKIVFNITKEEADLMPHYHQNLLLHWTGIIRKQKEKWRRYTDYHFSSLRGQTTSLQEGIKYLNKRVKFVIASPRKDFIDFFVQQVFKREVWQIGPLHLAPCYAEQQVVAPKLSHIVKYLCLSPVIPSPIVLADPEAGRQFISPIDGQFSDLLYECMVRRMVQSGYYAHEKVEELSKFQLIPDYSYLERMHKQGKLFARTHPVNYRGHQYEIRGYIFPLTLYADPSVQTYVYTHGLGAFTQQGFGMVELHAIN